MSVFLGILFGIILFGIFIKTKIIATSKYGINGIVWSDRMWWCMWFGYFYSISSPWLYLILVMLAYNLLVYNPWHLNKLIQLEKQLAEAKKSN